MPTALIVEDDQDSRAAIAEWARLQKFTVRTAGSIAEARAAMNAGPVDVAILDLQLPDGNGNELVLELVQLPDVEVLIVTGYGSVDSAVDAIKNGAIDYLTKPVDLQRLRKTLAHIKNAADLRDEVQELRGKLRRLGRFGQMIGRSPAIQRVYDLISHVAPTDATVLVTGETGVGKELVAQMIHDLSRRASKPFVPINCGAVAPNLIESELFGHEKGSFTGAERQRKGIFERAHGGTLFLDEITEMPVELQVKLLRVLETGAVTRVGGEQSEKVDVRIVAASNRDPAEAITAGRLREDLLYRLNVFPIPVPPLRERDRDVEQLANHFLEALNLEAGTTKEFSGQALERLRQYAWPGNVRELKNVVERAFILAPDEIDVEHLPLAGRAQVENGGNAVEFALGTSIAEAERRLIVSTLEHVSGDKKEAARLLGISLKTLYNRLREYGAS